jgi:GntR family transcriptional regulator of vanillate catabolism
MSNESVVTEDAAGALGTTQTLKAVLGLRALIVNGQLAPGERVSETLLVSQFGVSRTPARMALVKVNEEGLLEMLPSGGFVVASFSRADISDAIEIRGTLEGMAARLAAERGVAPELLIEMKACVADIDTAIATLEADPELARYVELNDRFHALLADACGSAMLRWSMERVLRLPFAAPNAFISSSQGDPLAIRRILIMSNEQHKCIVEAIENRQGARAQALTAEHSQSAMKYLRVVAASGPLRQLPALRLMKRSVEEDRAPVAGGRKKRGA